MVMRITWTWPVVVVLPCITSYIYGPLWHIHTDLHMYMFKNHTVVWVCISTTQDIAYYFKWNTERNKQDFETCNKVNFCSDNATAWKNVIKIINVWWENKWSVYLCRTTTQKGTAAGKPWKLPGFQLMSQLCHMSSSPHQSIISLPIIIQGGKESVPAKYFLLQILIKWLFWRTGNNSCLQGLYCGGFFISRHIDSSKQQQSVLQYPQAV